MCAFKFAPQSCGEPASKLPCRINDSCSAPDEWLLNLVLEPRNDGNSVDHRFLVFPIVKLFLLSNLISLLLQFKPKTPHPRSAEDHVFLADPFHVLEHLLQPCLPIWSNQLPHRRGISHKNIHSPLLFTPGDTPACYKSGFAFHLQDSWGENIASWNSDEDGTCVSQEKAGFKYLAWSNFLLQLHTLKNPFKVLQSCGLKFTTARSDLADTVIQESLC